MLDRAFIFGDGIYEVIPVYGGNLFRFEQHIERLNKNLDNIRIKKFYNLEQWSSICKQLIDYNGKGDLSLYLQISRGVAKRDHAFPGDNTKPGVFLMCNRLLPISDNLKLNGIHAVTLTDNRWSNCHIKSISLLPNILSRQQAVDAEAQEAILLRNGIATEGAASNLFIVKNNVIKTPEKSSNLLPGITRDLIVEICHQNNINLKETQINERDLISADEIWMTSSTKEILAVTNLNSQPVGTGKPGQMWGKVYQLYQMYKQSIRDKQLN